MFGGGDDMKVLEVKLGRRIVGLFVPPVGGSFSAMLANVPQTYMRAFVTAGDGRETWRWQLPDIKEGERLSFRMIDAPSGTTGVKPHEVQIVPPKERARIKAMARRGYARAMRERAARKAEPALAADARKDARG